MDGSNSYYVEFNCDCPNCCKHFSILTPIANSNYQSKIFCGGVNSCSDAFNIHNNYNLSNVKLLCDKHAGYIGFLFFCKKKKYIFFIFCFWVSFIDVAIPKKKKLGIFLIKRMRCNKTKHTKKMQQSSTLQFGRDLVM